MRSIIEKRSRTVTTGYKTKRKREKDFVATLLKATIERPTATN